MSEFQAQLPRTAKPGQYAIFSAFGNFLRMQDFVSNGLGMVFQVQRDGTLRRVQF